MNHLRTQGYGPVTTGPQIETEILRRALEDIEHTQNADVAWLRERAKRALEAAAKAPKAPLALTREKALRDALIEIALRCRGKAMHMANEAIRVDNHHLPATDPATSVKHWCPDFYGRAACGVQPAGLPISDWVADRVNATCPACISVSLGFTLTTANVYDPEICDVCDDIPCTCCPSCQGAGWYDPESGFTRNIARLGDRKCAMCDGSGKRP